MAVRKNLSLMGSAHLITFILNFASVIVVSRLLTPEEIGIYSVSVAVLGIAHIFRDFGVGQYLVQAKDVGKAEFRAAFSVTLYASWLIALLLFLGRTPLASLYGHPGVSQVLGILCLNFLILPFGTPLLSIMQRELQFNFLAINMILATLVQVTVTIACAYAGQSYLSMAWGALVALIAKVIWLNIMRPGQIFMLPSVRGLKNVLTFGSMAGAASIIKELGNSAPDLILGRTLGFAEVAFFSRATSLKKMLIARIVVLVQGVYFPTFAKELRNGADGAELYSKTMAYLVAILAPILAVMAIVSKPLILFLFGEQWLRSAPLASLVCLYTMMFTPYHLYTISLTAAGEVKRNLKIESITQSVQIGVLLSSIWLPLEKVVMLLALVELVRIGCAQHALKLTFGLGFKSHLTQLAPSMLLTPCSAIGPALVIYFAADIGLQTHEFAQLLMSAILAATGWVVGVFLTNHPIKNELFQGLEMVKLKYRRHLS